MANPVRARRVAPLLVALVLTLPLTAAATTVGVTIRDFSFSPGTTTVAEGDSVRWTNSGGAPHTATSLASPADFDTGTINSGSSATRAFASAGTYPYYCAIHPAMRGVIQVGTNTAPSVSLSLAEGASVSGIVQLEGAAFDAEGPHTWIKVSVDGAFLVGGTLGLQTAAGTYAFSVAWDTRAVANGAHTLTVTATDGALAATPAVVHVTVLNPLLPDLTVTSFTATYSATAQTVALRATVRNVGTAAAGPFDVVFTTTYQGEEVQAGKVRIMGLAKSASVVAPVDFNALGKVGTWTFTVHADPANTVVESIDTNNQATVSAALGANGPQVDLQNL